MPSGESVYGGVQFFFTVAVAEGTTEGEGVGAGATYTTLGRGPGCGFPLATTGTCEVDAEGATG